MTILKNQILKTGEKLPIVYDMHFKKGIPDKPVVIFCHGYKGFKDWGAWNLVAERFAAAGFFFLKFNFSHNGGTVENPIDFPDLEAFALNNFSKELYDLNMVLELIANNKWQSEINKNDIALIGHSRGGGIVLIQASENPLVKKVITWASVSDFGARFQENSEEFNKWKETGVTYVENSRTKQQMPHYIQFFEDFKANEERLNIKRAVKNLKNSQLILHGSEDTSVSKKEALQLHEWNPKSKLGIIEGADHVFGASHPWSSDLLPKYLAEVVDKTIDFLKAPQ